MGSIELSNIGRDIDLETCAMGVVRDLSCGLVSNTPLFIDEKYYEDEKYVKCYLNNLSGFSYELYKRQIEIVATDIFSTFRTTPKLFNIDNNDLYKIKNELNGNSLTFITSNISEIISIINTVNNIRNYKSFIYTKFFDQYYLEKNFILYYTISKPEVVIPIFDSKKADDIIILKLLLKSKSNIAMSMCIVIYTNKNSLRIDGVNYLNRYNKKYGIEDTSILRDTIEHLNNFIEQQNQKKEKLEIEKIDENTVQIDIMESIPIYKEYSQEIKPLVGLNENIDEI